MLNSYTLSVLSLPVPGQVATHGGGPEPWPKRQPGRAPTGWYLVPSGERRKGGRQASYTFLGGEPQGPFQDTEVPQVDTGQGRATGATARVQGSLMTAVFCCRFPSCSGQEAAWGGGARRRRVERRREVNTRPQREPVPCVQRTPAASGPRWVAVCVEMKLGGDWREGRVSKWFSAVIHPSRLSWPTSSLLSGVRGWEGDASRSAHPLYS